MNTLEYLTSLVPFASFKTLSEIKAKSILNACSINHSPADTDTYLIIGKNIVPYGLHGMGFNDNGIRVSRIGSWDKEIPDCTCETIDGEVADLIAQGKRYDYVIAPDEWLTFAEDEQEQIQKINWASKLTRKGFYTTLKDYKNMHASQRFFEDPFQLKTDTGDCIIIRKRDWSQTDRQAWIARTYMIHNDNLVIGDLEHRRTMYFKQLAKFSSDANATGFQVEKKIMYKPMFSKSFEYIIYISF
jgi:hypothetical protein